MDHPPYRLRIMTAPAGLFALAPMPRAALEQGAIAGLRVRLSLDRPASSWPGDWRVELLQKGPHSPYWIPMPADHPAWQPGVAPHLPQGLTIPAHHHEMHRHLRTWAHQWKPAIIMPDIALTFVPQGTWVGLADAAPLLAGRGETILEALRAAHATPHQGWTAPSIATFILDGTSHSSAHQRLHAQIQIARLWEAWRHTPQGGGIARLPLAPPEAP